MSYRRFRPKGRKCKILAQSFVLVTGGTNPQYLTAMPTGGYIYVLTKKQRSPINNKDVTISFTS
ncbi:hypothetical protein H6G97_23845 [Nostoc flagelliforme FACHB-838]|uniref:Uncharacterized protein n=1 Tax=Nostoc flagelliforme FACHB-838 TaxID=2692904 RepID=A0ABR8DSW9_9NOSO|nr:hypothetical protein [Nostoc flagelliforme]MBD2532450.1 hypothetical protein [Nostoc flagelliforme FACHB-838]